MKQTIKQTTLTLLLMLTCTASAFSEDLLEDIIDRVQLHGYAQGGFNYTHQDGEDTQTFDLKRVLFWVATSRM